MEYVREGTDIGHAASTIEGGVGRPATKTARLRKAGGHVGERFDGIVSMLEEAVAAIKAGRTPNLDRQLDKAIEINLRIPALIPDDYLPDVHTRLIMYKRISAASDNEELLELRVEMIDRFGLLPEPLKLLFRVTQLRLKAEQYGIKKVDANISTGRIEFNSDTDVDPLSIVQVLQDNPQQFKLGGANQLQFTHDHSDANEKLDFIDGVLERLRLTAREAA